MMVGISGFKGTGELILKMIGSALDLIVHIGRKSDGRRCVLQISELHVINNELTLKDIFTYDDASRKVLRVDGAKSSARAADLVHV